MKKKRILLMNIINQQTIIVVVVIDFVSRMINIFFANISRIFRAIEIREIFFLLEFEFDFVHRSILIYLIWIFVFSFLQNTMPRLKFKILTFVKNDETNDEIEKIVKFFISMIINDFVLFISAFNSIKNRRFRKKKNQIVNKSFIN